MFLKSRELSDKYNAFSVVLGNDIVNPQPDTWFAFELIGIAL